MRNVFTMLVSITLLCMVSAAQAGDPCSYGVWFDRDTVDEYQATNWGAVDGGTYNTGGIYDVTINYHAVDATTATMFATINGVQQGFWTDGWQNAPPDYYPAGLSFTSNSLDALKVFQSQWSASYTGTANVSGLTVNGTPYADFGFGYGVGTGFFDAGSEGDFWVSYGGFNDTWNLMAGDLMMTYTIDLSGLAHTDPAEYVGWVRVFEIGLMPAATDFTLNPAGAGWMGNCWLSSEGSPGTQGLNDKFDLQNAGGSDEWDYDVVVPEPSSFIALFGGLGSLLAIRRRKA